MHIATQNNMVKMTDMLLVDTSLILLYPIPVTADVIKDIYTNCSHIPKVPPYTWYEQFLQVGRLYWALILLGL